MVAVNVGMRTIFDSAYTERLNVSEFIDAIDPRDIPLLAILGWGSDAGSASAGADSLAFPCTNTTHTWQNDELIPSTGNLTSAYTSGGGTITVGTTEILYIKVDDMIMINDVQYIVDAVNTGAGTFDVTALEGFSDASHADGSKWYNMGSMRTDGQAFTSAFHSTDLSSTTNYTQIFHDGVSVSGTSEATEKFGITDEFDREFDKKFQEMVIKMERAAHYGLANALPASNPSSPDQTLRRMGGLYGFIRQGSGAITNDANNNLLTEKRLVDVLESIWNVGGRPNLVLGGATQKRVISSFITPYVRTERTEDTAGVIVGQYESEFTDLMVGLDRYLRPTDLVIVTTEMLGIGPLKGNGNDRSFFVTPGPPSGDSRQAYITGEYTMEVRNNTRAHGWIYDLGTTLV